MKILNAQQIRDVDNYTIRNKPISSLKLMEQAAWACTKWIKSHFQNQHTFFVFCGMGNNGGDGLAVARQLANLGRIAEVYVLKVKEQGSLDFEANKKLAVASGIKVREITSVSELPAIHPNDVIIDAILGSGLTGTIKGLLADVIQAMNNSNAAKISIDLPSGLFSDDNSHNQNIILKANYTLSLHLPKLALLLPENSDYVGLCEILPIGLDNDYIASLNTNLLYTTPKQLLPKLLNRSKHAHKGNFGHALIVSGSKGKMGATILAAKACLRSGVGLLTVHVPSCGYEILQISVPEAMVECNTFEDILGGSLDTKEKVVGVGPGIGTNPKTADFIINLLKSNQAPMVIDADALNILSEHKAWLKNIPESSILTPHNREFERLVGTWKNATEKLKKLKAFSIKYRVYVVLKGAYSAIATPKGNIYFNSTGNSGMATGGSGDVLTGLITGLLAQKYPPKDAALIGVYLHGLAGDIAVNKLSEEALIATDIIQHFSFAFKTLKEQE